MFLINDKDGFIILSGDARIMPILAFSPHGSISVDQLREVNGLRLWFSNTMEQIEDDLKDINSVHPIVYGEWKKYTEDFDPRSRIWDYSTATSYNTNCYEWYQYGQFMCNPYFTLDQTGPLYSNNISWGQSGISNFYAPTHPIWTCPDYCGRSPIGCGAVAIAQTVWHYKRAQSFYSAMPRFSHNTCTPTTQGQYNLAFFLYQTAQAANTTLNFGGCNGMTLPSHIRPALTALGMQSNGSISTFDPHKLRNEIAQGHPAIFYGHDNIFTEWHIWTSDGYKIHKYKSYNCDTDSCVEWQYSWYYMNWGWNGKYFEEASDDVSWNANGFYATGIFQPRTSNNNYNNNLRMITGIR